VPPQVLCCEVDPIFGTMLGSPAIMASLFGLLGRLKPLDCMLAGYFSRVLTGLLLRRAREVLRHLQARLGTCCFAAFGYVVLWATMRNARATARPRKPLFSEQVLLEFACDSHLSLSAGPASTEQPNFAHGMFGDSAGA